MSESDDWQGIGASSLGASLTRRRLLRYGLAGTASLPLMSLLQACGGSDSSTATATGSSLPGGGREVAQVTWALPADAATLDFPQAVDGGSLDVVPNLIDTLFRFNLDTNELEPALATEHRYESDTTLILDLREGVSFHDGSTMTAEDVAFSMNRHLDKDEASYFAQYYSSVESIEVSGPLQVTVKLRSPDATFLVALGSFAGAVASQSFVEQHRRATGTPSVGIVATGPYRFGSWKKGQEIVLERFDDHWDTDAALKVQRWVGKVITDTSTQIQGLRTGDFEGMALGGLSGRQIAAVRNIPTVSMVEAPLPGTSFLGFNVTKAPFNDPRVRKAAAYGLDRETFLSAVQGGFGEPAKTLTPPSTWSYGRDVMEAAYEDIEAYAYDPDRARALISDAGPAAKQAGELLAPQGFNSDLQQAVGNALTEIGLNITLRPREIAEFTELAASDSKPYAAIMSGYFQDFPDPMSIVETLYRTRSPGNAIGYSNTRVDRLIADQKRETDDTKRAEIFVEIQTIFMNELPYVSLFSPNQARALANPLGGLKLGPLAFWVPYISQISGDA